MHTVKHDDRSPTLDEKLGTWRPETAAEVARMVSELIEWADSDALDLMSARRVEQEVLDLLDADSKSLC